MPIVRSLLNRFASGRTGKEASPPAPGFRLDDFDPADPQFLIDPYPAYAAMRAAGPCRSRTGAVLLSRYADVVEALGNEALGNAPSSYAVTHRRNAGRWVTAELANNILPFQDPPRHDLPRRVVARCFHAHCKERPLAIDAVAEARTADLQAGSTVDLLADFATPFSLDVVCDLLGFPRADGPMLRASSEYFFYLFSRIPSVEVREEMDRRLASFRDYAAAAVAERRSRPRDDLTTALLAAWTAAGDLSEAELVDTLLLIFADAVENVDRCIATAMALCLMTEGLPARLLAEPGLAGRVVAETLRYESPAQSIARVTSRATRVAGMDIGPDKVVLLFLGAANRDGTVFPQPDRFDVDRGPTSYLSFGKGRHSCIGGSFVRLETEAAIMALLRRHPGMRLAGPELRWLPRLGHRWLERLDVRL